MAQTFATSFNLDFLRSGEPDPPVTVVRDMHVRPEAAAHFELLMGKLIGEASRQPGHLGATVIRPHTDGQPYRFVYKFDRRSSMLGWHDSAMRESLFAPIRELVQTDRFGEYPGLETWFDLPAHAAPPKWKTTLLSWGAIYTLVVVFSYALKALPFKLSVPVATLVLTAIVVPLVAYVAGPLLGKVFHGWLHAGNGPTFHPRTPQET